MPAPIMRIGRGPDSVSRAGIVKGGMMSSFRRLYTWSVIVCVGCKPSWSFLRFPESALTT